MYKSCKYCGRIHQAAETCRQRPKGGRRLEGARERKFRDSYAWRKKRAEILERDHYLCKLCLVGRRINYDKISVHHIEPLSERFELRLRDSNLISLCPGHHQQADKGDPARRVLAGYANKDIPPLPGQLRK